MELKTQIIHWILNKQRDYHAGLALLKQLSPIDPLLHQPESDYTSQQLFKKLGYALKTVDFTHAPDTQSQKNQRSLLNANSQQSKVKGKSQPSKSTVKGQSQSSTVDNLPGLKPQARLSLEITDHKKTIAYNQRRLHKARTDAERKQIIFESDQLQDKINYAHKTITALDSGEIDSIPEAPEPKGEDPFEVPAERWQLDDKIRRLRSTRSKRASKMKQLAAKSEQDSPAYRQAAADFEQFDAAVRELDKIKKEMK